MNDHGLIPQMAPQGAATVPSQDQIDKAVAAVREICGWHVWPRRVETLTVDSAGDDTLFLPTKKVNDVTAVTIGGVEVPLGSVQWSEDGMLFRAGGFPCGFRNVTVTLNHGHDSAPDLADVCLNMATRSVQPQGSMSVGGISVGAASGVSPHSSEWRIVDLYKLGPLP